MSDTIYRVTVRTTGSLQPSETYWQEECIYCGTDRTEARTAYHRSAVEDRGGSYGNSARETIAEMIDDDDDHERFEADSVHRIWSD